MMVPPAVRTIAAETHGRYLVRWPAAAPRGLLVGFHGYGENAEIHLRALDRVGVRGWALVSVQALNRFYTRADDAVVANWMTREDRELAIADNRAYVRAVVDAVDREFGVVTPLVFAGFSQGVAMAYRAAVASPRRCAGLVILAGDVPPEIREAGTSLPPTLLGRGAKDSWYTDEKMAVDVVTLTAASARLESMVFEGGHEWASPFLEATRAFLEQLEPQRG